MAETAVRLIIDGLVPLLTEEANLLSGVHREVEDIKHELESIVAFLKNADRRADVERNNIDNGIRVWVKELREAAFKIEDTTDEYTHFIAQQRHSKRRDGLIARMENESARLSVISLVGTGGLGKTTLANQIYVHAKGHFDCHAWVEVTQSYYKHPPPSTFKLQATPVASLKRCEAELKEVLLEEKVLRRTLEVRGLSGSTEHFGKIYELC
ncbi:hypothetical protein TIFTF001_023450 [Ficus carica]|uniref:Uncharacterized protein n=1 Tax=Ficus carica TaxID=3494 RepID=A0AA88DG93_FICCA|nr:hypothetical protein TIFTF001_023450 [Ficus carica]